jgi:hypothetical protein
MGYIYIREILFVKARYIKIQVLEETDSPTLAKGGTMPKCLKVWTYLDSRETVHNFFCSSFVFQELHIYELLTKLTIHHVMRRNIFVSKLANHER